MPNSSAWAAVLTGPRLTVGDLEAMRDVDAGCREISASDATLSARRPRMSDLARRLTEAAAQQGILAQAVEDAVNRGLQKFTLSRVMRK